MMVLLNPLFIIELIGDAHNDGLFALLILIAVIPHRQSITQGLSLGLSIATKHISLALAPLFLAVFAQQKAWKQMFVTGITTCVAIVGTYALLWVGPKTFDGLLVVGKHFYATPLFFPQKIIFSILRFINSSLSMNSALQMTTVVGMSFAVITIAWLTWRVWQGRLALPVAAFYALCAMIFLALQWVQPWYIVWPLALVPFLQPKHAYRAAMVLTLVWFVMLYTLY